MTTTNARLVLQAATDIALPIDFTIYYLPSYFSTVRLAEGDVSASPDTSKTISIEPTIGYITLTKPGVYRYSCQVTFQSSTSGTRTLNMWNETANLILDSHTMRSNAVNTSLFIEGVVTVVTTTQIIFYVFHTSAGGSQTLKALGSQLTVEYLY